MYGTEADPSAHRGKLHLPWIKKKKGSGHIRIEAYQEKEELKLLVKDDGCGMSEEICRKILSDEIEPENISGSGIGVKM